MVIKIRGGITATGNGGDGIRIEGDVDLDADNIYTANNGGQGLNIIGHASIMEQFGLPKETDPKVLAQLLLAIRSAPENEKQSVVKNSSLWGKFSIGAINTTTFVSNLIAIANSPQAMAVVARLMQ